MHGKDASTTSPTTSPQKIEIEDFASALCKDMLENKCSNTVPEPPMEIDAPTQLDIPGTVNTDSGTPDVSTMTDSIPNNHRIEHCKVVWKECKTDPMTGERKTFNQSH